MLLLTRDILDEYLSDDVIAKYLEATEKEIDAGFASQVWLKDSAPKRALFHYLYGDLLDGDAPSKRVLDVGGGYTSLTRMLAERHDYYLLDFMAHDPHQTLERIVDEIGRQFWIPFDWYEYEPAARYDLIIANDIFPNVDQRLGPFLDKYLRMADEIRVSLTYYNFPRWYKVRRVDGEEIFHIMAWSGRELRTVLQERLPFIVEPDLDLLEMNPPSLFPNGRQVCLIAFKTQGDRK